jgi:hypothetical protein
MSFSVEEHGFCIIPNVIDVRQCLDFIDLLGPVSGAGRRGLLLDEQIAALSVSPKILNLIQPHLPKRAVPVRAIYFDKTRGANWAVSWHQDLLVAVGARIDVSGFGPWSMKEGIIHVQPPIELLEQMLTLRLHLDDADGSNGALRVLPGSHRLGQLSSERIDGLSTAGEAVLCEIAAGGALLMRPLLLHSSSRCTRAAHRRVIHIEYAGFALPEGLHWSEEAAFASDRRPFYGNKNNRPWPASNEI